MSNIILPKTQQTIQPAIENKRDCNWMGRSLQRIKFSCTRIKQIFWKFIDWIKNLCHRPSKAIVTSVKSNDSIKEVPRNELPLKKENTPLHTAAKSGNLDQVKTLLEENIAGIDIKNENGASPLIDAVLEGHFDVVEFLINRGADIDVTLDVVVKAIRPEDNVTNRLTLLHCAVISGNRDVVTLLLDKGLDKTAELEFDKVTPFFLAAERLQSHLLDLLIDKSIKNKQNVQGMTAMDMTISLLDQSQLSSQEVKEKILDQIIQLEGLGVVETRNRLSRRTPKEVLEALDKRRQELKARTF